jgi:subtilisin
MARRKKARQISARTPRRESVRRYVVLPPLGLFPRTTSARAAVGGVLQSMATAALAGGPQAFAIEGAKPARMRIIDSIREDGAKLVEIAPSALMELRAAHPGLRIVPEIFYRRAVFRPTVRAKIKVKAAAAGVKIVLRVVGKGDGKPVAGATVVAFTDFALGLGAAGTTSSAGKVSLDLGASSKKLERLYVYPALSFWPALLENVSVKTGFSIELLPIDLTFVDCVRFFYGSTPSSTGAGVTVGVVDSGIDLHNPDLTVSGGLNTVDGESAADYGDGGGEHHGTHVAGIIAARGTPPTGIRGIAPGVTLRSYRVYGQDADVASNFAIAKAIDAAAADNCDLLNLSLGSPALSPGQPPAHDDEVLTSAIADARAAGVLVLVAAGNEGAGVGFPASDPRSVAVSAMGRMGTFPASTEPEGSVGQPAIGKNFFATFSNRGPEVDLIGTGVGVISTVVGGYAIMSGTSMACPAVTGVAARLLSGQPLILVMRRDQSRSDAIAKLLFQSAQALGFGPNFEGHGLLQ